MAKLRKEKEKELYEELSKHQEFMRNQLESQRKQEASNEDERIQLAVQEQIEKREVWSSDAQVQLSLLLLLSRLSCVRNKRSIWKQLETSTDTC